MKLRGSEWQTVWIVFRRDASERGREESRRVTNDCMQLMARPGIWTRYILIVFPCKSIDIFKGTLDRRAHMKLRGSEWQTVWIVFRRDASERGREESRRVTNDCMPLVARPQISHPMTDVSKAKTWNSFDFFLCTSYIDKYRRWRCGAKKYS